MRAQRVKATIGIAAAVLLGTAHRNAEAKVKPTEVFLYVKNGKCTHDVSPDKLEVSKKKDLAIWEFTNDGKNGDGKEDRCGKPQDVILCPYIDSKLNYTLFEGCVSTPVNGLTFGVPFTVNEITVLRLVCLGRTETKVGAVFIDSDDVGTLDPCSLKQPPPDSTLHHVIGIQIVP